VVQHPVFYLPDTADRFDFTEYDYVVDAVDTVTAKLSLIQRAKEAGVPIISSMGAGNKLDASAFRVVDIYKTRIDPLARVMRKELKKRGVKKLKVVYSEEMPLRPLGSVQKSTGDDSNSPADPQSHDSFRRSIPGSTAFVPSVAGLIIAGEVIKDLTKEYR
jgi:tRNA A37 threonylcarbamoyladenosine dehydratase